MLLCRLNVLKKSKLFPPGKIVLTFYFFAIIDKNHHILSFLFLTYRSCTCGFLLLWSNRFKVQHTERHSMKDTPLHSLSVTSGYLTYCYLSYSLNQSGHSSLTSAIKETILARKLLFTGCFVFLVPVNPKDGSV